MEEITRKFLKHLGFEFFFFFKNKNALNNFIDDIYSGIHVKEFIKIC